MLEIQTLVEHFYLLVVQLVNFFLRLALPEWQAPGAVEAAADPILPEVGAGGVEIRKPSPAQLQALRHPTSSCCVEPGADGQKTEDV